MLSAYDTTPLPPGSGFRFAVGSASGPHSSVYRVWTSPNSSDVYLTCVPTSKVRKISFHASGEWHLSILSEVAMQYVSRNSERHLDKWKRPQPFADDWYRVYQVVVPRTELRCSTQKLDGVRFAPDPGPGYWTAVELIMAGPNQQAHLTFEEAFSLGRIALVGSNWLAVMAHRFKPKPEQARVVAELRDHALQDEYIRFMIADQENPILGLHGIADDGTRSVTEVALSVPPAEVRSICTYDMARGKSPFEDVKWVGDQP